MASPEPSDITTQSAVLRAELKEWERAFAAANEGRKAGRNDIKQAPEIAAKYKEYSRLKSLEKSFKRDKNFPKHADKGTPKKRKHALHSENENNQLESTPRKAAKGNFTTPSKPRAAAPHPSDVDPYDSPSALRRLFSPSTHLQSSSPLKTAIGPTPQRDGKALGLFDLLSESGGSTATPSATRMASVRGAAAQTPSKRRALDTIAEEEEEEDSPGSERTPSSTGKSYMLSALFATPTTWRYATMDRRNDDRGENDKQTNTAGPNQGTTESETPLFLRRSHPTRHDTSNPTADNLSPVAVRKPRQFVGKGLSALVQGLRDMEEERADEDLDILREMEAEQEQTLTTEVADSQTTGNDAGRPYKKKGQKRTTRRVRMKPVISKSKHEPQLSESEDDHEPENMDHSDDELMVIPETQQPSVSNQVGNIPGHEDASSLHSMSEPELDSDSDYEEPTKPLARSKSFSEKMKEAIGVVKPQVTSNPEKAPRPPTKEKEAKPRERKVNPQAHANYRSLKIRNKNSKGRGAGRFGRRR
ncbi:DNA replication regulator sld2 [Aspergillus avenaceus]|uniref:DNA replication regulator SLD2 n=1 Tax=Aspergillus avenaceus TaxID=36643 RepID=A0A5N6U5U6_ASPAV|nr:DNA replication regulator sld2 [Aspergillus avenaceus]